MRSLILLWLPLWLVYLGVGALVSGAGFRHLDLSFVSLCAALLIPFFQALVLLIVDRVVTPKTPPGSLGKSSGIRPSVTAILVTDFVALQILWLTTGTSVESTVQQLTLRYLLALQLGAVALTVIVDALVRGRARRDGAIAVAIALPAIVAACELVADPLERIVTAFGMRPLLITLFALLPALVFLAGLIANAGRFRTMPVTGRLADWALGAFFCGAAIRILITHGGAQLGPWWVRLAGTFALLCTSLLTAALIQARYETPVRNPGNTKPIWWTSASTRVAMVAVLLTTYLGGWFLVRSVLGATPSLEGEWGLRAAAIPSAQAAFLILAETVMRRKVGK